MNFRKSKGININELRAKLYQKLTAPIDAMWELLYINSAQAYLIEKQGKTYEEIQAQWYDPNYWTSLRGHVDEIDALIDRFNARSGLLETL